MSNRTVAIIAGATLLVGVLIGRASASGEGTNTQQTTPAAVTSLDPKNYPRTKEGAATAAAAYNDAFFKAALMQPDQRQAVVEGIATGAMKAQIANETDEAAAVAAKLFDTSQRNSDVAARMAPLGYRVVTFSKDSARVNIWTLMLLGKPDVGHGIPPQFRTATVDLAWEEGAWRLAGTPQGKEGPTPRPDDTRASTDVLIAVNELQEYSHAAL
jgi:hypothetical protein